MRTEKQRKTTKENQSSVMKDGSDETRNWAKELKKSLCLGRLVWIRSPHQGDSVYYAKGLLRTLGFENGEMPYLSAAEFLFCCRFGFLFHMTVRSRVLLVGEISRLDEANRRDLMKYLGKTREFKMMFELNVVLVGGDDDLKYDLSPVRPLSVRSYGSAVEPELNEIVHDWLEEASVQFGKKVHRLSEEAADFIELLMEQKGAEFVKPLIFQLVKRVKGRAICWADVEIALIKNELDLADIGLVLEKNDVF